MKNLSFILLSLLFICLFPQLAKGQLPTEYKEWRIWPKNTGYCQIYVREYPGKQPVYFISDIGLDYSYFEQNVFLDSAKFHEVFFDQPGVTGSICYDTSALDSERIIEYINIIHSEIGKGPSFDIVCHGNGCLLATAYYHLDPSKVESIQMIQAPIFEKNEQLFIQKREQKASYLGDLNKTYGAVFFPEVREKLLKSLSGQLPLPEKVCHFYLTNEKAKDLGALSQDKIYKLSVNNTYKLGYFSKKIFWNELESQLIKP